MTYEALPSTLLEKASLRGNEYAWPLDSTKDVINSAACSGLACIGGVFQFRNLKGTGEPYWLCADSGPRLNGEVWATFCARVASEVISKIDEIIRTTDMEREAERWSRPGEAMTAQHLVFVPYFESIENCSSQP